MPVFWTEPGHSHDRRKYSVPDALVTCHRFAGTERIAPNAVVVFEVLSPDSGRRDRIEKVREYAAVGSIRRYVIVETVFAGLLLFHRKSDDDPWTAQALTVDDVLALPEIGIEIPVADLYEDVDLTEPTSSGQ